MFHLLVEKKTFFIPLYFLLFGRSWKKSCFEQWNVHFMWMNSLRFNVRSTSVAALHIQGLGGIRVLDWMKKTKQNKNKKEEESTQWKLIQNIYLTTVALFTFRNCNKDLWGQKLTLPAMGFILSLIMAASYWILFLRIKHFWSRIGYRFPENHWSTGWRF